MKKVVVAFRSLAIPSTGNTLYCRQLVYGCELLSPLMVVSGLVAFCVVVKYKHRFPKDSACQFAEPKRYECGYLMRGWRVTAEQYQLGFYLRYSIHGGRL
jgi:hypothetical protein